MARTEAAEGSHAPARRMADGIIASRTAEIERMEKLLDGSRPPRLPVVPRGAGALRRARPTGRSGAPGSRFRNTPRGYMVQVCGESRPVPPDSRPTVMGERSWTTARTTPVTRTGTTTVRLGRGRRGPWP
ncbi:DUF305 domain-containing protein [Streptomyces chilikensis]|uniref:DUF305 domain-containing protein n=1 Tax=Streptomyces chilikensis TaxID=1194079 RepID=A0ABV3ES55_9ACTN